MSACESLFRNMCRNMKKLIWIVLGVYIFLVFSGIYEYLLTKKLDKEFDYPLNIDLKPVIKGVLAGKKSEVKPINFYPYKFFTDCKCSLSDRPYLVILVKSAMHHFSNRAAIRSTYGRPDVVPGRIVTTRFFLGTDLHNNKPTTQIKIEEEIRKYNDVVQMNFHDEYFNNTIKTMMMFKWAFDHCYHSHFYLFTDDDMYISIPNTLNYINKVVVDKNNHTTPLMFGNVPLFAGYVFKSAPQRFIGSKWQVHLEEYPWDKWPPYITAGAYIVSNKSMRYIYIGSLFVKHFRFDDIYLGIIAKKIGLEPTHCDQFYYYKKVYSKEGYENVIASHGYSDPNELIKVWAEQHRMNYYITVTPVSLND